MLKAGFFTSAQTGLETALFRGHPHRGMGSRQRLWMSITGSSLGDARTIVRSSWTCTNSPQSVGGREAGGSRKRIVLGWPSRGFLGQPVPNSHR
jgi:hypothetical protein